MSCPRSHWLKLAMLSLIFTSIATAQAKYGVLHSFGATGDGEKPMGQLLQDKAGNLYGTTYGGGADGYGSVFELSRSGSGWNETVLYSFQGSPTNLQGPEAAVVMDGSGNLYGTTYYGGNHNGGTIFELSPSNGSWVETALYVLQADAVGGGLLLGRNGELYGAASVGEFIYEVHPPTVSGGNWTGGILFRFNAGSNGQQPLDDSGALIADKHGNLYGTTVVGGAYRAGEVFELSPPATQGDPWTETVLYSFGAYAGDGLMPGGSVVMDGAGNLYSTTTTGGTSEAGTVWELSPPASEGQPWTETILYNFAGGANDGSDPRPGVVLDKSGNLYGVTYTGGTGNCISEFSGCGTVFEVSPAGDGTWSETVLHIFTGEDGQLPYGGLILSDAGYLYGTTTGGGAHKEGTLFEVIP
jgi:uncharacterized repeat protein (TIGR03803 family)